MGTIDVAGLPATIAMRPYAQGADPEFADGFGLHLETDPGDDVDILTSFLSRRRRLLQTLLERCGFMTIPTATPACFTYLAARAMHRNVGNYTKNQRGNAIDWHQDGIPRVNTAIILQAVRDDAGSKLPPTGVTSPAALYAALPESLTDIENCLSQLNKHSADPSFIRLHIQTLRSLLRLWTAPHWEHMQDAFVHVFRYPHENAVRDVIRRMNLRLAERDALYIHEWTPEPMRILILGNRRVLHAHIDRSAGYTGHMNRIMLKQ